MKALTTGWRFFIYSNLFIACIASLMTTQVYLLVLNTTVPFAFPAFVFFSTLCSYSFHWYFTGHSVLHTPRERWLKKNRFVHVLFFFTGLTGMAWFFLNYFTQGCLWIAGAVTATLLYTAPKIPNKYLRRLRKAALGKTIFLAAVWTYVTTVLPVIFSASDWTGTHTLFTISRYFLIYAICILFDYRDRSDDKAAGVRSLITYLDLPSIRHLFIFSLLVFTVSAGGLLLLAFSAADVLSLLLPGLAVAALWQRATTGFSDMLYYFVLDGLMAISSLLTLFTRI